MDLDSLLLDVENGTDINAVLFAMRDTYGLDHVAYAGSNPVSGRVYGLMTYPEEWQNHYLKSGYYRIDPTLNEARRSIAPVDWARLDRSEGFRKVFADAHDFGISDQGLTVPVRGPLGDVGGLSVSSSLSQRDWTGLKGTVMRDLQAFAVYIHDRMMREDDNLMRSMVHPTLSSREVEILQWIAAGKSQQDIGDILSISARTVEVHLRSARTKLNALTTAQAIGRAIGLGLIHPE